MSDNLQEACLLALRIPKEVARKHAEKFSWQVASEQFVEHLKPKQSHTTVNTESFA
jgi:glutamate/tyrosine decarboxylase-like PLP-dependent enzyme